MKRPPNLILFNPETIRADAVLGERAGRAQTPALDRLATQGFTFNNCFCQSPFCAPSRISMFTGQYPHTHGHRSLLHLLHAHERNLFRDLKEAGYKNVVFGKNDLMAQDAIDLAFDEVDLRFKPEPSEQYLQRDSDSKWNGTFQIGERPTPARDHDWAIIESALAFLAEPHDQPFCLFLPLRFAHPPYVVEEPWFSLHDRGAVRAPLPIPDGPRRSYGELMRRARHAGRLDEADFREIRATYYGMISRVDSQLQQLLDALHEHQLEDETAVLYFSDHGDYAGDYGMVEKFHSAFEDALVHVPLVLRVPELGAGRSSDQLVEMTDLYATVLEIAGVEPRHDEFSRSLLPLLRGREIEPRDAVFCEGGYHIGETQAKAPISPNSVYAAAREVFASRPNCNTRAMMVRTPTHKYIYCPGEHDELFDLRRDPGELHNVANDPAYRETVNALRERLLRWMLNTGDVLPRERDPRGWHA
jgi:arylsulfatase A-like enzyme